ncbi:2'-5' RNA ligase family protein [Leifsonia sp. NPDC058292]|uniref:2'-5' RNA ligase family protein n=1 Tax=Leifsonia sp. NPDC058292 TaxID=3346428 RepID=UPI0036DC3A44
MKSYAVVALFNPLDIGTTISRHAWPGHVTLASNFTAAAAADQITEVVAEAAPAAEPLSVRFGEHALFGPNHDVRVRLVESKQAVSVHSRVADHLESLPGFAAEEPAYWRDGYRPHLTLGPSVTATECDRETASFVAIVEILDTDAKVLALFHA